MQNVDHKVFNIQNQIYFIQEECITAYTIMLIMINKILIICSDHIFENTVHVKSLV
jgi:ABC-type uncharacterized transport system permease subunit